LLPRSEDEEIMPVREHSREREARVIEPTAA